MSHGNFSPQILTVIQNLTTLKLSTAIKNFIWNWDQERNRINLIKNEDNWNVDPLDESSTDINFEVTKEHQNIMEEDEEYYFAFKCRRCIYETKLEKILNAISNGTIAWRRISRKHWLPQRKTRITVNIVTSSFLETSTWGGMKRSSMANNQRLKKSWCSQIKKSFFL